jgi:hypothetical protein
LDMFLCLMNKKPTLYLLGKLLVANKTKDVSM